MSIIDSTLLGIFDDVHVFGEIDNPSLEEYERPLIRFLEFSYWF